MNGVSSHAFSGDYYGSADVYPNLPSANEAASHPSLVVIDPRNLERACFVRCIGMTYADINIVGFASIEEWRQQEDEIEPEQIVLFNIGNRQIANPDVAEELRSIIGQAQASVVVMGDSADLHEMMAALDCGALGYVPSSVGIDEVVQAARLAAMGGIFLPRPSLLAMRGGLAPVDPDGSRICAEFTDRQFAVADALRRGKPNKIIAYELGLCESTVKVHIRNIMKKLKANNRTEAAFKLNRLSPKS